MPTYFLFFLATLATALLLYAGGLATLAVRRRALPGWLGGKATNVVQAGGLALLWMNVGVTWLLFFNVYRIHVDMSAFGNAAFQGFTTGYTRRLPIVVLPYGAMCLAWSLLLWSVPTRFSRGGMWAIATLLVVSVASTPWAAGALGLMHDHGYSDDAQFQLQAAHLARSLSVTLAALWALVEMWRLPASPARAQASPQMAA
jgi:hypothetical protein